MVAEHIWDKSEGHLKWPQERRENERTVLGDQGVERITLISPTERNKNRGKQSSGSEDIGATSSAPPRVTGMVVQSPEHQ